MNTSKLGVARIQLKTATYLYQSAKGQLALVNRLIATTESKRETPALGLRQVRKDVMRRMGERRRELNAQIHRVCELAGIAYVKPVKRKAIDPRAYEPILSQEHFYRVGDVHPSV